MQSSVKFQIVAAIACLTITLSCIVLVLLNYSDYPEARYEERMFGNRYEYSRLLEVNMIVFFATLLSTSRDTLLFAMNRLCKRRVHPALLNIMNITIKLTCLTLFDFRLIHIHNTLITTRYTILFADICSLLLAESIWNQK